MYLCRLKLRHSIYMTTLDIILLVLIGTGAVLGFAKGFLRQLAGLLGLIVGLLAAKALYATVADEVFSQVTDDAGLARGLAFVAIWLLVPLLFLLVASLLTRAMEAVSLGWLNRLLGAALGAAKYALCISLRHEGDPHQPKPEGSIHTVWPDDRMGRIVHTRSPQGRRTLYI